MTAEPTPPLSQRMRAAAETIEEINAMAGMGINCSVSPLWLRREAAVLEQEWIG
jgi:hypothetical protein